MNAGSCRELVLAGLCLLGLVGAGQSLAEEHGGPGHMERGGPAHVERDGRGQVLDNRFNHGHYYPPRGQVVRELPAGYRPYMFGGNRFFFYGGVWYAPGAGGFLVTRPPIGLYVNVLPPFYTTLWFGGVPFYYANDVYYQWSPAQNGYVVAAPPPGADQPGAPEAAPPPPAADDFFVYPRNGQTQEQQAADRYECHNWAKGQTGFDPTQPAGGDNGAQRPQYQRAITACLEARGYSVK
ncbi:MAG: DUF6515 family protein [Steroidobacteraceae bacterium]|jgi:hypothetical protein